MPFFHHVALLYIPKQYQHKLAAKATSTCDPLSLIFIANRSRNVYHHRAQFHCDQTRRRKAQFVLKLVPFLPLLLNRFFQVHPLIPNYLYLNARKPIVGIEVVLKTTQNSQVHPGITAFNRFSTSYILLICHDLTYRLSPSSFKRDKKYRGRFKHFMIFKFYIFFYNRYIFCVLKKIILPRVTVCFSKNCGPCDRFPG